MMVEKSEKFVLVVDDEKHIRKILKETFRQQNSKEDCPYLFQVQDAENADQAEEHLRNQKYQVVILDIVFDQTRDGLALANSLGTQFGKDHPVTIMFSGQVTEIAGCVRAMRDGAWDYIIKTQSAYPSSKNRDMANEFSQSGVGANINRDPMAESRDLYPIQKKTDADLVVESAISRLRMLDTREELIQEIAVGWLPSHFFEMEQRYAPGTLVALWHKPTVNVIASGQDAFELEKRLRDIHWREHHQPWELPYLLQMPVLPANYSRNTEAPV